ncbi:MAG TPA: response regulator transcription factor [Armatimonadetes bacterium]|jgi:DNA-binding response OmpR family regulator|nr:response regulator transcription factor [Armatimonadota bacterium]
MSEKVLIIEDEQAIADSVAYSLAKEGFEVRTATDGAEGLALAEAEKPDLLILDLLLPGMSGLDVCRTLRRTSSVPIIMLTARGEEVDRVVGLEVGADDYVTKPFSMRELIARVRAVLRRVQIELAPSDGILRSGDLEIDTRQHLVHRRGQPLRLALKEFEVLRILVARRGEVVSRKTLLEEVWGGVRYRDPRTVDVHIRWLREKIEENPSRPRRILTVHGIGYRLVE